MATTVRHDSLRGLHRVRAEWKLVCLALNLLILALALALATSNICSN